MAKEDFYDDKELHESYGVVGFSRYTVGPGGQSFFGSAIKSATGISLRIKTAYRYRNLNNDWIHGDKELIEVQLSPNQFADLITTMNVGDGVPCTISYYNGKRMADPPETHIRQLFDKEFKQDVKESLAGADEGLKKLKGLLFDKASIGKKDREEIYKTVESIVTHVKNGMPFVQQQFNEAMDKVVTAARAEVEAFVEQKIRSVGIETLQNETRAVLAPVANSPVLIDSKVVEPE